MTITSSQKAQLDAGGFEVTELTIRSCSGTAREELHENINVIRKSAPAGVCFVAALQWVKAGAGLVPGCATALPS